MSTDDFQPIPAGHIAAVVTVLELRARPVLRPEHADPSHVLRRVEAPDAAFYLDLYRRVGAPHLWYSRLAMDEGALAALLADPEVELHALFRGERADGILELDFRVPNVCEIAFFGVVPELAGTGAARVMMNRAITLAFDRGVDRVWVHTNSIDHPRALDFYRRSGFRPIGRFIESAPDPRLSGLLPRDAAPNVPIIG